MAIEPLSSVMSIQAQQTVQTRPVEQPARSAAEYTDGAVNESAVIDKNISVIENATQKGDADSQTRDQQNQQASNEQIKKAVEQLNKSMANSAAVFGIHEDTNRVTIKIVDKDTKEVIKELPPEKTLDMISKVWELAGIMVDEKR